MTDRSRLIALSDGLAELVAASIPSVVTLRGVTEAMSSVSGSGFIIDDNGHVLTNQHVVEGVGQWMTATLSDGTELRASIVGADIVTDLAIIRLPATAVDHLSLRSSPPRAGELCVAIGSPLGEFTESVSLGVVSGLERKLPSRDGRWPMEHMVQTDAAINPGNSGGPLLDMHGEVIGVNESGRTDGQNINFAVPADVAMPTAQEIIQHGDVRRPALGCVVRSESVEVDGRWRRCLVVASPLTADTRLRAGDVILEVGGLTVPDRGALFRSLTRRLIGQPTPIVVLRNGREMSVEITPTTAPFQNQALGD